MLRDCTRKRTLLLLIIIVESLVEFIDSLSCPNSVHGDTAVKATRRQGRRGTLAVEQPAVEISVGKRAVVVEGHVPHILARCGVGTGACV